MGRYTRDSKALKYARKHKNTTIYIPKGEYHIRRPLVIYDSTTLIMDDEAVLKSRQKILY